MVVFIWAFVFYRFYNCKVAGVRKQWNQLDLREFRGAGSRDASTAGLREVSTQDAQSLLSGERRDPFRRLIQLFKCLESPTPGEFPSPLAKPECCKNKALI